VSLSQVLLRLREGADRVIETSCATIILKGDKAYKIKKSVDYGFLDFTTPEKRRAALLRELSFNQRMAADIYLGIEDISGESILVMRRFDTNGVLSEQASERGWTPDARQMHELGQLVARFHGDAVVCRDVQHANNTAYVIDSNRQNINIFRQQLGADLVDAYDEAVSATYAKLETKVGQRFENGCIRHCHGDLHLGNILIEHDKPVLFDCIEFNDRLSQIDVLYDLAFLLMDLWVRGHHAAANQVMNIWLEEAARQEKDPAQVYAGLELLPLYMSMRAAVRCHVHANSGDEDGYNMDEARAYLQAAQAFLKLKPAELQAVGGLSGSGKSTRARSDAPQTGRAPGAVILRSDEIRKRLWACPAHDALPSHAYAPEESVRVYEHMFDLAQHVLRAGQSVILDATFRESWPRERCDEIARIEHVAFSGLWLDLPASVRAERVGLRKGDVSDATSDIAIKQQAVDPSQISWRIENADAP
jgi:aminoglycoside phosphotransferase family enzyme/predicted kinase